MMRASDWLGGWRVMAYHRYRTASNPGPFTLRRGQPISLVASAHGFAPGLGDFDVRWVARSGSRRIDW